MKATSLGKRWATLLVASWLGLGLAAAGRAAETTPDPSGTNTGDRTTVVSANHVPFVPPRPQELSAEEKKNPATVQAYEAALQAYNDYVAQAQLEPLAVKLADSVGHYRVAINFTWTLMTGFLVMFMQAGFALVETGLCRAKNANHTMAMNFMIYPLGILAFYVCGFALMFGGGGAISTLGGYAGLNRELGFQIGDKFFGICGGKGFFLKGAGYDTAVFAFFLFQMVFMDTAATIPTGSMAERWKFSAFMLYGCLMGAVVYPFFGNWVWGGGWLAALGRNFGIGHGVLDFAGSSVVHLQGGMVALVGAWLLGPRLGKYNKDGSANPIVPHNLPMVMLGTFILAFGWFGFNSGSSLAATDLRIGVIATNTMLASAAGAVAATMWMWRVKTHKPDSSIMCSGLLAGLVAITAPCAFVTPAGAVLIGLVAGVIVVESIFFLDQKVHIDDPVGAISIHGVNGVWGCLALGLFADGTYGAGWNGVPGTVRGLFYGGGCSQLLAQLIGVITCIVVVGGLAYGLFKFTDRVIGNRVDQQTEIDGLDVPELGIDGYGGMVMDKDAETPNSRGIRRPASQRRPNGQ